MEGMEGLAGTLIALGAIILVVAIAIYVVMGIVLNKLNKAMYGKGTALAWIPICNTYLLGKLTVNKLVGWILVICIFVTDSYTTTVDGVEKTYSLLPASISSTVTTIYGLVVLGLFIYAIVKYNQLKHKN